MLQLLNMDISFEDGLLVDISKQRFYWLTSVSQDYLPSFFSLSTKAIALLLLHNYCVDVILAARHISQNLPSIKLVNEFTHIGPQTDAILMIKNLLFGSPNHTSEPSLHHLYSRPRSDHACCSCYGSD
jgi:hypothetical protein